MTCPTRSIRLERPDPLAVRGAARSLPEPLLDGVRFCGYASASSYGASSYLVERAAGNVLVDSPRAARPLCDRIAALGGVAQLFLTHRDDVADHARLRARFGCERVLHEADVGHDTRGVERRLAGRDPVRLAADLVAIPTPGHTAGSTCLLFGERVLFTGDHLWGTDEGDGLEASRGVCWYSWPEQLRSLSRLLEHRFEVVLPGHGRAFVAPSAAAMRVALEAAIARLRRAR